MISRHVEIEEYLAPVLFGQHNRNLKLIQKYFPLRVSSHGNVITLQGDRKVVDKVQSFILALTKEVSPDNGITEEHIRQAIQRDKAGNSGTANAVYVDWHGKPVVPKSPHQQAYVDAIRKYDIVFAIGPAGTGKTYLAVACALKALAMGDMSRIILTRPVVEAGEKLGFLPGDLYEKVEPYLNPLYDALYNMLGPSTFHRYRKDGIIEIVPLAYMRGRTLSNAFIILDEAQNTIPEQMKMFLTRLGTGINAVITGDITQVDLEKGTESGLIVIRHILKNVKGLRFVYFNESDVVRHRLVKKIVAAYNRHERKKQ